MISCEQRNVKPYSLPVQCLPYHSINQQQLRKLISKLVKEMTSRGMKVSIVAEVQNTVVSKDLPQEVSHWRDQGVEWKDIISRL